MTSSEKYVSRLFKDRYGILLRKIDERDGIEGKKPDFEYIKNRRRVFVCELKDYDIVYPSEEAGWYNITRHADGSVEGTRESNAPNRISRNIYNAYKQLREYNEPKILIFLNQSSGLNVSDLDETYKGYFEFSIGGRKYIDYHARPASKGKIKDIKNKIDLYIWIDKANPLISGENDKIYIRTVTDAGKEIVRKHF